MGAETENAFGGIQGKDGEGTLSALRAAHGVHPIAIARWKRQLLESAPEIFQLGPASGLRRGPSR